MSPSKRRESKRQSGANMTAFARAFTPTANKRLNELIGFLMLVFAVLLFLSLVSYSPLDPSLNTVSPLGRQAHNWIGVFGAMGSDLALQALGVTAFLVPVYLAIFAVRWFRSRTINSPLIKITGALALLMFCAAMIGLLPWSFRWRDAIPAEGLLGRIVADAMIHYLNVV